MATLAEVLAETSTVEYSYVDGYEVNEKYIDENVVEVSDRVIGDVNGNVSTYGEEKSQAITFRMSRFFDGIDITETGKLIKIHYELADGTGSDDAPVNVKRNDTHVILTWIIPAAATVTPSEIHFIIYVIGDGYIFKTLSKPYTINATLDIGGGLPEPDESWYVDFLRRMEAAIGDKYVIIRYSVNSDGTNFHDTPTDADNYVGFAVVTENVAPTDKTKYSWAKFRGPQGIQGIEGIHVTDAKSQWYLSTSSSEQAGGSWIDSMPEVTETTYLWNRTHVTKSNGDTITSTPVLVTGINDIVNDISARYTKAEVDTIRKYDGGNYNATLISKLAGGYSLSIAPDATFTGKVYYEAASGNTPESVLGVITAASALTAGTKYTIGTLPSGYYPTAVINDYDSTLNVKDSVITTGNAIEISMSGVISITPKSAIASGSAIYFYVEW